LEAISYLLRKGSFIIWAWPEEKTIRLLLDRSARVGYDTIQIGVPDICNSSVDFHCTNRIWYFRLLRHWLQECDEFHDCTRKASFWPKRIIYVGDVTRQPGKEYIWIDSLCIIQEQEGNADWLAQASDMENIFVSAYCTIAATSTNDWNDGFLPRKPIQRPAFPLFQLEDNLGRRIYIDNEIDNFEKEVDGAPLNQRAWVLQERLLSSRTIHFAANHIFWECGDVVRCNNFSHVFS
jgi:heterokaryon incompatibility protein (HET)